jgi:hypothetical protein
MLDGRLVRGNQLKRRRADTVGGRIIEDNSENDIEEDE